MKREDFRRELVRVLDRTADVVPAADRLVAGYVADVGVPGIEGPQQRRSTSIPAAASGDRPV
jgi:hypothetical protein